MDTTLHADVLVLGFGKGGKTVAAELGRRGRRVVLVEQSERMYGGTCPNVGCVPSKGMLHHSLERRPSDPPQEYYARSVAAVQDVREFMRVGNLAGMSALETVTVLTGPARFLDAHRVAVQIGDEEQLVSADSILINSGSEPVVPDIPGLRASARLLTSTDLLETTQLPPRMAIVGGGYLGLEFAGIYHRFGSRVTVLEAGPQILAAEDDDVADVAQRILLDDGIEIVCDARVLDVQDAEGCAVIRYERAGATQTLEVDAILPAVGRAPVTHDLGLEAAGVRTGDRGAIVVDEHLRTSQPHIYALGDVNGGPQFTYVSLDDSRVFLDQVAGGDRRTTTDRTAVPHTLFMTPPLATVGLTERAARAAGRHIKVASQPVADILAMPRAYAMQETRGLMKFVLDADTDQILGAALLSIDAQELINTVALAMRHGIPATALRDAIYTHPSSTEAFNEVLGTIVRTG